MDPTLMDQVRAPWTEEQVASLDAFQGCTTCTPLVDEKGLPLVATRSGLMKQGTDERVLIWAHRWMLDWSWKDAPKQRSGPKSVNLHGALFPMRGEQPTLLSIPQSPLLYLPCFTTEEKLWSLLNILQIPVDNIKTIDDPLEFLGSLKDSGVTVILDLYFTPEGKIRYQQIQT